MHWRDRSKAIPFQCTVLRRDGNYLELARELAVKQQLKNDIRA